MTLTDAIKYLYPSAVEVIDFAVEQGVSDPFIRRWSSLLGPQPTQAALDAAMLPAAKGLRIKKINAECRSRLIARYGDANEQVSRSIGIYGLSEQQGMQTGIAATIEATNTASDAVDAATTVAAVEAVTVTWPAI